MNAVAQSSTPQPARRAVDASAPQLRTILLTDLCDSTALVERLGDHAAAELFRAHDSLVLALQQTWRGRLIDRSDGLLLLFERPIDGLGFALDYARGLDALGRARMLTLRARAGLHVGEVLTWRNTDEAVRIGAKPLEVEGLAKPMAARLMTMARPGQILLSAVAEPLAHRAVRELGERGQQLLWKSWGRWRFKGVPETQEVFEVGEPGLAPLRAPPNSPKAWRDLPLWRRPAALAAEAALLAGLVVGAWFITRPAPAIAFNERDWVVVADLRNLTGQAVLDDSLEQAFRISLEQSRHVNVLSDLKARDTLARMRRPANTALDRATASEIALRDGARAVILPTVAEVGGRVRVSAEVIDPHSQATVYAQSADGDGIGSALGSIDKVTASLRGQLGEEVQAVERDSKPLPQVTTSNLDALRAYALGQKAMATSAYADALRYFTRATDLDQRFALAWLGQMRARLASVDTAAALAPLRKAQSLREHLAAREALYLDAWVAGFDSPAKAAGLWSELASIYPDYWPAHGNTATALLAQNRFDDALVHALRNTSPQNELAAVGFDLVGRARLGREDYKEAAVAFDSALARGFQDAGRRRAATDAASGRFDVAAKRLREARASKYAGLDRVALAIDRARFPEAVTDARALVVSAGESGFDSRAFPLTLATSQWLASDPGGAAQTARQTADAALASLEQAQGLERVDDAMLVLAAVLLRQRVEEKAYAGDVVPRIERDAVLANVAGIRELATVVKADALRFSGKPEQAIELLSPLIDGHELYQTRAALLAATLAAEDDTAALEHARWLQRRRGLAYIELGCGQCLQALNVADSNIARQAEAIALVRLGRRDEAKRAMDAFDQRWPPVSRPRHLRTN